MYVSYVIMNKVLVSLTVATLFYCSDQAEAKQGNIFHLQDTWYMLIAALNARKKRARFIIALLNCELKDAAATFQYINHKLAFFVFIIYIYSESLQYA